MTTKKKSYFNELENIYGQLAFGDALRAYRETEGKTQVDFAKELDISVQNLCDIEKGRCVPSPCRVAKIAKSLKLPEKALIEFALRDSLQSDGLNYSVELKEAA